MNYDYRNRPQSGAYAPPGAAPPGAYAPPGAPPLYPRVAPHSTPIAAPLSRALSSSAPPSSGSGIRVQIKPEYCIPPPPPLAPMGPEVPRCTFEFDFDFERKVIAEAEKEGGANWSRIAAEQPPPPATGPSSSPAAPVPPPTDPVVDKYVKLGLLREAVEIAVLNYGDNNVKIREFVKGFNFLREMGFLSRSVGEALAMFDNDTDKALGHLLNSTC